MDPLDYFSDRITDTRPPKIQGIQIVPIEGKGVVNGKSKKLEIKPVTAKKRETEQSLENRGNGEK